MAKQRIVPAFPFPSYIHETGSLSALIAGTYVNETIPTSVAYSLVGGNGSFALTGNTAKFGFGFAAGNGSFTLTGNIAKFGFGFAGGSGSFTLTGETAKFGFGFAGGNGSFALTGNTARFGFGFAGGNGSFTLTGEPASFQLGFPVSTGSFTLTGEPATLSRAKNMPGGNGSFALTGETARFGFGFAGGNGLFALTGEPASFGLNFPVGTGSFTLTGEPATLVWQVFGINGGTGVFSLTGGNATFTADLGASTLEDITSQFGLLAARGTNDGNPRTTQALAMAAYGPPETRFGLVSQGELLAAVAAGEQEVITSISQASLIIAYGTGNPVNSRQSAWTFVLDGHRFYVLPLGPEGDWAFDTTTREWCKLNTQGLPGLNFTHGTMWGLRILGGDAIYTYLYEMDPSQPFDESWREIQRKVTGGIPTRSRASIGVGNFTLTASVGDDQSIDQPISLAFSDDNGVSWSEEFEIPLTDVSTQTLIWSALGSFAAPGRVFRITDTAGPVRLDGADCVLTIGSGVDSSQDQDGDKH